MTSMGEVWFLGLGLTHGETIKGAWKRSPQRGPGPEPLVGVREAKPPEAENLFKTK